LRSSADVKAVRAAILAEGGLLAAALRPGDAVPVPEPARLAASGPRVAGHSADIEFAVAAVHEGYLLHYGRATLVDGESDPDFALLAGDRLYAMGLERLAAIGDAEAVAVLADVIARCAQVHAAGDPGAASAVWHDGARAIGWGHTDGAPRDRV
jgi:hypothetical protein